MNLSVIIEKSVLNIKVAEEFYNKTKTFLEETNPQLKLLGL